MPEQKAFSFWNIHSFGRYYKEVVIVQIRKCGFYVFSLLCFIAMIVCVICDYAIARTLTWSKIVLLSLSAGWFVSVPFFKARNHIIRKSLIVVSIIIFPFLAGLRAVLKVPLILSMGGSIAASSLAAVWGIYGVFVKYKKRLFLAFALSLLIEIPFACGITHITTYFLEGFSVEFSSDLFHITTTLVLSGTCLIIDSLKLHHSRKERTKL